MLLATYIRENSAISTLCFSKFFSKNVTFTKFLPNKSEIFHSYTLYKKMRRFGVLHTVNYTVSWFQEKIFIQGYICTFLDFPHCELRLWKIITWKSLTCSYLCWILNTNVSFFSYLGDYVGQSFIFARQALEYLVTSPHFASFGLGDGWILVKVVESRSMKIFGSNSEEAKADEIGWTHRKAKVVKSLKSTNKLMSGITFRL